MSAKNINLWFLYHQFNYIYKVVNEANKLNMKLKSLLIKISLLLLVFYFFSCDSNKALKYGKINSHPTDTLFLITGLNKNSDQGGMGFRAYLKHTKICPEGIQSDVLESKTGKIKTYNNETLYDSLYLAGYDSIITELSNLKFTTQVDSLIIICEGKSRLLHLWSKSGDFKRTYDLVIPNSKELPAFGFYVEGLPIVDSLVFFRLFKSEVYVDNLEKWKKITEDAPLYKLNLNTGVIKPFGTYPNYIKEGKYFGYPFINSRKGKQNELLVSHPKNHFVECYNLLSGEKTTVLFSPKSEYEFEEYDFKSIGSTKYGYEYQVKKSQYTHAGYDGFSKQYYRFYNDCSDNENRCLLTLIFSDSSFNINSIDTLPYGKYFDNILFFDGGYYLEQYIKSDSLINYAYEKFLWN